MLTCWFASYAQIPNGSFETWTGNDPNSWVTTNGLILLGNPQSVFKSTDAHSGTSACEINTVHITNKPPGVFIPDFTGSIFTGKQVLVTSYFGFPYTSKPTRLNFWYKYNARNNDTASVIAYTTKWNSSLNKRDTLAIAVGIIKDSVGMYTQGEVFFMMMDSVSTPDSAVVLFASSSLSATQTGAKLLLDDIEFAGGNVGLAEKKAAITFTLSPNPVGSSGVTLQFDKPVSNIDVSVFDVQGKLIYKQSGDAPTGIFLLDTGQLLSGVYILSVQTEKGNTTSRLIIE